MKLPENPTAFRVVLYEGNGATPLDEETRFDAMARLLDHGYMVSATGQETGSPPDHGSVLLVLGQFDGGTVPDAEDAAGEVELQFRDITGLDPEGIHKTVDQVVQERDLQVNQPGQWKPWFPVIDYDRCTNCMQCLSFCLFGVYGVSEQGQIQVQNEDNCKTDCPACSRVCPEVAIMFPKYKSGPINGEEVKEEDVNRESMKVDISSLLGGDIYETLRQRSEDAKERFARERDENRAVNERKRCLKKLKKQGIEIPDEVAESLPSADEIQQNAAAAQQTAPTDTQ